MRNFLYHLLLIEEMSQHLSIFLNQRQGLSDLANTMSRVVSRNSELLLSRNKTFKISALRIVHVAAASGACDIIASLAYGVFLMV